MDSNEYVLLVRWRTVDAHEKGFRLSPEYQRWKALLRHFYDPFPTLLHFKAVEGAASSQQAAMHELATRRLRLWPYRSDDWEQIHRDAAIPDYQFLGYAIEAAIELMRFAFEELGLAGVYAECDTRNIASRRVMEKSGMKLATVLKRHQVVKGVMTDSYRFELRR